ncbi:MAG: RNA polymerase subunit sigma-70 [Rhodospirillales bacterium 69-11]|nr:sigma-70 family RNA polymerase sigma factor [Rhodospirillales bacterium]MBN8928564.1 sigma-70 family RNA polymerase sigma factor [Rhodospirillales bacterium]OJW19750.1 MAG: RNA polymerase subunit sigma-70 [Rhodospirillales bacterium 69-11]
MSKSRENNDRSDESDELEAAKPADAAVRRALVEARHEFLAFLQQRVGSKADAEELLQRFSLRALERASQLRDVRSVRGWLGRILATTIVDHQRRAIRKRQREVSVDPTDFDEIAVEPDRETDEAICNCLHKLLPTMKPDYADILWRSDILGEPRDRIAASLGTTLNNVTVRLHRARQTLRKRLEEMCLTCPVHGFLDCRCDEAEEIRRRVVASKSTRESS